MWNPPSKMSTCYVSVQFALTKSNSERWSSLSSSSSSSSSPPPPLALPPPRLRRAGTPQSTTSYLCTGYRLVSSQTQSPPSLYQPTEPSPSTSPVPAKLTLTTSSPTIPPSPDSSIMDPWLASLASRLAASSSGSMSIESRYHYLFISFQSRNNTSSFLISKLICCRWISLLLPITYILMWDG